MVILHEKQYCRTKAWRQGKKINEIGNSFARAGTRERKGTGVGASRRERLAAKWALDRGTIVEMKSQSLYSKTQWRQMNARRAVSRTQAGVSRRSTQEACRSGNRKANWRSSWLLSSRKMARFSSTSLWPRRLPTKSMRKTLAVSQNARTHSQVRSRSHPTRATSKL